MTRRGYQGAAAPTRLAADVASGATSMTAEDITTWAGITTNGKFSATIARGRSDEEQILVQTINTTTGALTNVTRGYADSTAVFHSAGATLEVTSTKVDFDEANAHINDVTLDAHTQYAKDGVTADCIFYVSATDGSDSNDGLSPGRAKLTLQAAIDAMGSRLGMIVVLGGLYTISTALLWTPTNSQNAGFRLTAPVRGATRIHYTGADWALKSADNTQLTSGLLIDNIYWSGTSDAAGCINLEATQHSVVEKCSIIDFTATGAYGIRIDGSTSGGAGSTHNLLFNNNLAGNANGILLTGDAGGKANANRVIGGRIGISEANGIGVNVDAGDTVSIFGVSIYGAAVNGIHGVRFNDNRGFIGGLSRMEFDSSTNTVGVEVTSAATETTIDPTSIAGTTGPNRITDAGRNTAIRSVAASAGAERQCAATFFYPNAAANLSAVEVGLLGAPAAADAARWSPIIAGSLAGLSWRWNVAPSAGDFTLTATVAGVATTLTSGAVSSQVGQVRMLPGIELFSLVQTVGLTLTTSAGLLPAGSDDLTVFLWVWT